MTTILKKVILVSLAVAGAVSSAKQTSANVPRQKVAQQGFCQFEADRELNEAKQEWTNRRTAMLASGKGAQLAELQEKYQISHGRGAQ